MKYYTSNSVLSNNTATSIKLAEILVSMLLFQLRNVLFVIMILDFNKK
jgi:hypothetical protein